MLMMKILNTLRFRGKKKRLFKFISFVTPKPHKSNETFFLINKTEVSTEIVNKLLEGIKGLQKKKRGNQYKIERKKIEGKESHFL